MNESLVVNRLLKDGLTVALAESCTGGLISAKLTNVAGCSECFGFGVVTYSNEAKHKILGVPWEILDEFGAVSFQTAISMAKGVRKLADAHIGLSVTGIAGPAGGSAEKPVGLVYIALAKEKSCIYQKHIFSGSRQEIRDLTAAQAMRMIMEYGVKES